MKINFFQILLRTFFLQIFWNYRKMQNIGRFFIVLPILKRLYKNNPEMLQRAFIRNVDAFNSNPIMASYSLGAMIKQEERISKTEKIKVLNEERMWYMITESTANTAASLGDRLFWATLKPFSLLFLIIVLYLAKIYIFKETFSLTGKVGFVLFAVVVSLLIYNLPALLVRYKGLKDSYNGNDQDYYGLIKLNWNKIIYVLKTVGQILTFSIFIFGVYVNFAGDPLCADLITRSALLVSFVILSVWAKRLNVPSIYLYIAATIVFCSATLIS